jgi:acyl homoserine lactone synthase
MESVTFELLDQHLYGRAFKDYLALRKRFFVDNLNWGIPHNNDVEMDQYDNPLARYSLVLKDGKVVAGMRALPTTARWGDHSYMLRDAGQGKLSSIPLALMQDEICSSMVWECTRLVISEEISDPKARATCLRLVIEGMAQIAADSGAEQLIALSNLWIQRALRRLGYDCDLKCAPYTNDDDGHKYAVMAMPVDKTLPHLPVATHRPRPTPLHAPALA